MGGGLPSEEEATTQTSSKDNDWERLITIQLHYLFHSCVVVFLHLQLQIFSLAVVCHWVARVWARETSSFLKHHV